MLEDRSKLYRGIFAYRSKILSVFSLSTVHFSHSNSSRILSVMADDTSVTRL